MSLVERFDIFQHLMTIITIIVIHNYTCVNHLKNSSNVACLAEAVNWSKIMMYHDNFCVFVSIGLWVWPSVRCSDGRFVLLLANRTQKCVRYTE